jgi:hypothetical protein
MSARQLPRRVASAPPLPPLPALVFRSYDVPQLCVSFEPCVRCRQQPFGLGDWVRIRLYAIFYVSGSRNTLVLRSRLRVRVEMLSGQQFL